MDEPTTKRYYTPRKLVTFSCDWCMTTFESRGLTAKFCSNSCRDRARYVRDRDKRLAAVQAYRAANREKIRAASAIARSRNPQKYAKHARESYQRHRERRLLDVKLYMQKNPSVAARTRAKRNRAEQFTIIERDLRRLLDRHRGCCAYCGVVLMPRGREYDNSLQWDHVLPLFRGGRDSIGNLLPSCRFCNYSKNRKTIMEWRLTRANSRW